MISASRAAMVNSLYRPWTAPGNVASYEADRKVVASTSWSDAGGRGAALITPGGAGTFPTYNADDGDGFPAFNLSGTTDGLENTTWGLFDPDSSFTIAAVIKQSTADDGVIVGYGDHADGLGRVMLRVTAGTPNSTGEEGMLSSTGVNSEALGALGVQNAWQVVWMRRSGTTIYGAYNGQAEFSAPISAGGSFSQVKLVLGFVRAAAAIALPYTGRIRAAAFFSTDLGAPGSPAREKLRNYWKSKWPGLA